MPTNEKCAHFNKKKVYKQNCDMLPKLHGMGTLNTMEFPMACHYLNELCTKPKKWTFEYYKSPIYCNECCKEYNVMNIANL